MGLDGLVMDLKERNLFLKEEAILYKEENIALKRQTDALWTELEATRLRLQQAYQTAEQSRTLIDLQRMRIADLESRVHTCLSAPKQEEVMEPVIMDRSVRSVKDSKDVVIFEALHRTHGNRMQAAKAAGVSVRTVRNWIKKHPEIPAKKFCGPTHARASEGTQEQGVA